ncbi:MAG: hypothetical protein WCS99_13730, partial [Limisphaerales bacterium]
MPKAAPIPHPIAQIRKALDVSIPEFARTLGISGSLLKKIEASKKPMSPDVRGRVFLETGFIIYDGPRNDLIEYSQAMHTEWRAQLPNRSEFAPPLAHVLSKQILLLLQAAGRPGVEKVMQVFNSVLLALERIKDEFHLDASLAGQQRDRHLTEQKRIFVGELRKNFHLAELYGFKDRPELKDDEEVVLEKPTGWLPTKELQALHLQALMAAQASGSEEDILRGIENMNRTMDDFADRMFATLPPRPQPPAN